MCSLDVRIRVECVFYVIVSVENSKNTLKTHSTVKRTSKLHIQNSIVIDPLAEKLLQTQLFDTGVETLPKTMFIFGETPRSWPQIDE
jgi:hypothetical protein